MNKHHLLTALFLLLVGSIVAQTRPEFDLDHVTDIVSKHVSEDHPGLAIGIVQDGEIIYERYMGYSNMEHAVKVNERTRFNIASDAKQYTALCILKLAEEGQIDVNEDFREYLPNVLPNVKEKITIINLINHTSGIRDYCDLIALTGKTWWKEFIDNDDVLDLMRKQQDLNFKPGSAFSYSNTNYTLLTAIVKKVTGQDFAEYAKGFFEGLGMPNTQFQDDYMAVIPNRAQPYGDWGNGNWRESPTITEVHGDGALYTTLRDQLKWEQIIQQNDGKYLSKAAMAKSQSLLEPSFEGFYGDAYGYGLMFDNYKGLEYTYHSGSTGPYNATYIRVPGDNRAVVIMTNQYGVIAENIGWEVLLPMYGIEHDQPRNDHPTAPQKVEKLKQISDVLGVYQQVGKANSVIRITEKDGSLYREIYQLEPTRLINDKGGLFTYEGNDGLKMNFTNIGKGEQQFTLYTARAAPRTFQKVADLSYNDFDKTELNGRYVNEETNTEIILDFEEDNTYSLTKNGRKRTAKLVLPDYVRMMDIYEIEVMRDTNNQVIGLNVDRDRIQNVIFKKT